MTTPRAKAEDVALPKCGCGGEPDRWENSLVGNPALVVGYGTSCLKCGISSRDYKTRSEADKAWKRAMRPSRPAAPPVPCHSSDDTWCRYCGLGIPPGVAQVTPPPIVPPQVRQDMTFQSSDPVRALADAWASIDGKLAHFRIEVDMPVNDQPEGHGIGYMLEAEEMIKRLRARGFDVVPTPPAASQVEALRDEVADLKAAAALADDTDHNLLAVRLRGYAALRGRP